MKFNFLKLYIVSFFVVVSLRNCNKEIEPQIYLILESKPCLS